MHQPSTHCHRREDIETSSEREPIVFLRVIRLATIDVRPHSETRTHNTVLGSGERVALETAWHCKRLVSTMAHYERFLTHTHIRSPSHARWDPLGGEGVVAGCGCISLLGASIASAPFGSEGALGQTSGDEVFKGVGRARESRSICPHTREQRFLLQRSKTTKVFQDCM